MVLRILSLVGQHNCMISSKVTTILPLFFQKKSKTSNVGMWGVYPEAIDWVSISEEKELSEPKNLQNWPNFLKCFWDPTSDILAQNEI